jgi:hypothetical protein
MDADLNLPDVEVKVGQSSHPEFEMLSSFRHW